MKELDNNMYRTVTFADLTADPNEVLVACKSEGNNEAGVIFADYIPILTNERNPEYDAFMKQYTLDHARCPKCGSKAHSTTYVGYILHMDRKDEYKDLNRCVCSNCGDVHTTHDRVK